MVSSVANIDSRLEDFRRKAFEELADNHTLIGESRHFTSSPDTSYLTIQTSQGSTTVRDRSPNKSADTRTAYGKKLHLLIQELGQYKPPTHKAVLYVGRFLTDEDDIKRALTKFVRKFPLSAFCFREESPRGVEHWHVLIRGAISKDELRHIAIAAICKHARNKKQRASCKGLRCSLKRIGSKVIESYQEVFDQIPNLEQVIDEVSAELSQRCVPAASRYTCKSEKHLVESKVKLYPSGTRVTRNIKQFFAPGEKKELWSRVIEKTRKANQQQPPADEPYLFWHEEGLDEALEAQYTHIDIDEHEVETSTSRPTGAAGAGSVRPRRKSDVAFPALQRLLIFISTVAHVVRRWTRHKPKLTPNRIVGAVIRPRCRSP